MYHVGIDLHKRDLVTAIEDERDPVGKPRRFACRDEAAILSHLRMYRPFRAVIEASASYRWLYERLSTMGAGTGAGPGSHLHLPFGLTGHGRAVRMPRMAGIARVAIGEFLIKQVAESRSGRVT